MKCLALLFCLIFYNKICYAKHVKLLNTDVYYIKSNANLVDYKIYIQLPNSYKYDKNKKYPVLYLLDAYWHFPINYNNDFIIVGIAYKDDSNREESLPSKRLRDLLPFKIKAQDVKILSELKKYYKYSNNIGHANKFKDFLQNELMIFINKKYRISGENILFGHSLGGLFASWILLDYPDLFQKYIILSPAVLFSNYEILNHVKNIKNIAQKKVVYMAVGEKENKEIENSDIVSDVKIFYAAIKDNKSLISKMDIIKNEGHISMCPIAIVKALRFIIEN